MGKRKRDSTAAYAASQPLFAALKEGCDTLEDQTMKLTTARDLVQNLHVKLDHLKIDDGNSQTDVDQHEQYADNILAAWQTATETYRTIFKELVSITAAQPDEGKAAMSTHVGFQTMLRSAEATCHAVTQLIDERGKDRPVSGSNSAKGPDAGRVVSQATRSKVNAHEPPVKIPRHDAEDDKGTKSVRQGFADKVSVNGTAKGDAMKGAKKGVSKKTDRVPAVPIADSPQAHQQSNKAAPRTFIKDGVKYEDVSAEVAARLKAKEDKLKAARAEEGKRKRKRLSSDANVAVTAATASAPRKKRSKRASPAPEEATSPPAGPPVEKQGTHDEVPDGVTKKSKRPVEEITGSAKRRKKGSASHLADV